MSSAKLNTPAQKSSLRSIPTTVWALGFVSMFMDISSEMIHALLPIYMVTVLGTSVLAVGIIEGIAEATASVVKVFSGALSDRLGKRKLLAALGYGLGALSKPVFPLAGTLAWLVGARFVDRIGKGIRGAPRDALVADATPAELRGAAYGLRHTLDMFGAFSGPLLAIGLMWLTASHYQTVFWIAVMPAFLAVAVLLIYVKEPKTIGPPKVRPVFSRDYLKCLGVQYWAVLAVGVIFTLARFSEAFLILLAGEAGLSPMWAPIVLVLMGIAFSLSAYPAGVLSDRFGRAGILAVGMLCLLSADMILALVPGLVGLSIGIVLWGIHMGFTQGVFSALIADSAPAEFRGTAFGMFHLATGVALLLASLIAGLLWDIYSYQLTFITGAVFALLALAGLGLYRRHFPRVV
jgi:MFS family permease